MAQVQQGESSTLSPEGQGGRGHAIESGSQIALGECARRVGGTAGEPHTDSDPCARPAGRVRERVERPSRAVRQRGPALLPERAAAAAQLEGTAAADVHPKQTQNLPSLARADNICVFVDVHIAALEQWSARQGHGLDARVPPRHCPFSPLAVTPRRTRRKRRSHEPQRRKHVHRHACSFGRSSARPGAETVAPKLSEL